MPFLQPSPSNSLSSELLLRDLLPLRKHPRFFLYRNSISDPMAATPAMGATMAMMMVLVRDPSPPCASWSLLAAFCSVAAVVDVGSPLTGRPVVGVRTVVVRVVKEEGDGPGVRNREVVVPAGVLTGGKEAVPVEEMREATDCSREEDDVGDDKPAEVVAGRVDGGVGDVKTTRDDDEEDG